MAWYLWRAGVALLLFSIAMSLAAYLGQVTSETGVTTAHVAGLLAVIGVILALAGSREPYRL
ncbi:MAG: hypothetical protein GSR78_05090 [Desulfurococcales archaeon]|nr:hypothetical protein [Desulfurococcales archaeon]